MTSAAFARPTIIAAGAAIVLAYAAAPARAATCAHLGAALVDHTCFHARFGPFVSVTAGGSTAPGQSLDAVHTYYRAAAAARDAAVELRYTPARSGAWAIFLEYDVPFALRDASGAELPTALRDDVAGCPLLSRVRVFELTAGTTYHLVLGPTPASEIGVVIEKLDDFLAIHGRDRDGDGFGDPGDVEVTPCTPAPGFAETDGDCDDADPDIHPAAAERCDGGDHNCNGVAGDVGLPCTVGLGRCAAAGVAACPVAGAAPTCAATPRAPVAEQCNGTDDDCDGVEDAAEALCGGAEAPRCIAEGTGGRRCGCDRDADCGGPDSGRICLLRGGEQRCISGCVDGFGRNGCPADLACSSRDPAQPGLCAARDRDERGGCGAGRGDGAGALHFLLGVSLLRARRRRRLGR
jgi:hypothetical protein